MPYTRCHAGKLAAVFALVLAVLATTGCASKEPAPPPEPATTTITFPKDSLNTIFYDDNPARCAKGLKERGDDYFTDVYAKTNGDVIAVVTTKQRNNLIKDDADTINANGRSFKEISPDYDYSYSGITKTLSVWADNKAGTMDGMYFVAVAPPNYGELYYVEGGTGPWDMDIYIYGCHSRKLYQHYKASQGPLFKPNSIPE